MGEASAPVMETQEIAPQSCLEPKLGDFSLSGHCIAKRGCGGMVRSDGAEEQCEGTMQSNAAEEAEETNGGRNSH
jgi:hypothetical protein